MSANADLLNKIAEFVGVCEHPLLLVVYDPKTEMHAMKCNADDDVAQYLARQCIEYLKMKKEAN